jgi:hypothetical protein
MFKEQRERLERLISLWAALYEPLDVMIIEHGFMVLLDERTANGERFIRKINQHDRWVKITGVESLDGHTEYDWLVCYFLSYQA